MKWFKREQPNPDALADEVDMRLEALEAIDVEDDEPESWLQEGGP